jgi:hypothetical protein
MEIMLSCQFKGYDRADSMPKAFIYLPAVWYICQNHVLGVKGGVKLPVHSVKALAKCHAINASGWDTYC